MRQVLFESKNVTIVYDNQLKVIIATWRSMLGPDLRNGVQAALAHVKKEGLRAWIADVSQSTTVPSQADQEWGAANAFPAMAAAGMKRFINVLPESSIVKMGVKRWSKIAVDNASSEPINVASLDEALEAAAC